MHERHSLKNYLEEIHVFIWCGRNSTNFILFEVLNKFPHIIGKKICFSGRPYALNKILYNWSYPYKNVSVALQLTPKPRPIYSVKAEPTWDLNIVQTQDTVCTPCMTRTRDWLLAVFHFVDMCTNAVQYSVEKTGFCGRSCSLLYLWLEYCNYYFSTRTKKPIIA